ncbi:MAG TPA: hypothetical protein PLE99_15630 [Candidatus Thiothrix moscowensis]|uniref:hypothetical protein n=1 Tax=Thiothrix sp. UBA2016 TaxID=1947695 RepID=UPI0025EB54AD|nr:hypothetical protein [Thiothrix sp. UBA2016]HRJ54189.1 hypothetical protein [Candidatus Thiothrix moscowensis]HRJ94455.1 hypothetical protein [Candidatus Thiothrix moscowensis]
MQPDILPDSDHLRALNAWHLRLAVFDSALSRVILDCFDSSDPASYHDLFSVLGEDLHRLVESCPFPPNS